MNRETPTNYSSDPDWESDGLWMWKKVKKEPKRPINYHMTHEDSGGSAMMIFLPRKTCSHKDDKTLPKTLYVKDADDACVEAIHVQQFISYVFMCEYPHATAADIKNVYGKFMSLWAECVWAIYKSGKDVNKTFKDYWEGPSRVYKANDDNVVMNAMKSLRRFEKELNKFLAVVSKPSKTKKK